VETKKQPKIISDFYRPKKASAMKRPPSVKNKVLVRDYAEKDASYLGNNHGISMTPSAIQLHAQKIKKTMQQPFIYDTNFIHRPLNETMKQKSYTKQALLFGFLWTLLTVSVVFIILYRIGNS